MKTTQDFLETYTELSAERAELMNRRTELENDLAEVRNKIAHLDEVLNHLAPLGDVVWPANEIMGLGLTDAIRRVLKTSTEKLSAQDVREKLVDGLYDLDGLTAPMASIYKVLHRLLDSEEVEREREGTNVFYRWKTAPLSDEDIPF